ncbi:hypothetical protein L1987_18141 [Smallanthus sonchifolius]|uniref:Uncharacterized protein n=1 Tax=Smallanthus sonchifolius TaxID=185202 RepID=A0ACB9IZF9_9ASTR|nr:hypothetical protein L1987_18141 [Smallanthus sonchifolius]
MEASPPPPACSSSNPTTYFSLPSHFNYPNIYGVEGENGSGIYSAFPIMPLKSDGSLCLMEAITRSQSQGMVSSTPPKLENFFGGVTMGTPDFDRGNEATMYYNQNPDHHEALQHNHRPHQHQIQPQHYQDYSGFRALYQTVQQEQVNLHHLPSYNEEDDITSMKNWISRNYDGGDHGGGYGDLQSLSLSMSFGCSQSQPTPCVTATSQQQIIPAANVTDQCVVMDTKKRGSEKVDQQKQIVHRKSLDTFGQRTSQYRGGYDMEEKAARAYDLAALKYWGPATHINFPLENYEQEIVEMKNMSRQEYVAHLRRRTKEVDTTNVLLLDQPPAQNEPKTMLTEHNTNRNMLDWKMTLYDQNGPEPGLDVDESSKLGPHLSNDSSLVTSLSSSREDSPERNNILPMVLETPPSSASKFHGDSSGNTWIPTAAAATQIRPHIPVFAAWTDA